MKRPEELLKELIESVSETELLDRISQYLIGAGRKIVYVALLLFYSYQKPDTPSWAKRIVLGSIAYLLAPIDLIPDLAPFLGLTDDLGILMFGLVSIAGHVNDQVKEKARTQMTSWFGAFEESEFLDVDSKI